VAWGVERKLERKWVFGNSRSNGDSDEGRGFAESGSANDERCHFSLSEDSADLQDEGDEIRPGPCMRAMHPRFRAQKVDAGRF
jgi:hypothetical protein